MNKTSSTRGFTLIELLAVIGIILIAASVIFIGGGGGEGAALKSSQRIVSGVAQGARGQAILKGERVRLIIHNDVNSDPEKYRRFFGIVYESGQNSNQWIAATQGTYLPEGIYFDPDQSRLKGWTQKTMKLEYPRNVPKSEGSGDDFYYYEFRSNGNIATENQNNWLVIRAGTLKPNASGDYAVVIEDGQKSIASALIFRRAGTTTMVNEPENIIN